MTIGIVGAEAAKFDPRHKVNAIAAIRDAIQRHNATSVVSGGCHLGGVDIWAEKVARELGLPMVVHLPKTLSWPGYRARNLLIAAADLVVCVCVQDYPSTYTGMRFDGCYHCRDRNPPHVKSGGCWTAWRCKRHEWVIV